MRINLNVPFSEKDSAKALGAKWDPYMRVWYVPDGFAETKAFHRWFRGAVSDFAPAKRPKKNKASRQAKAQHDLMSVKITRSEVIVPHCGCYHVLPWEHCEHTDPQLDEDQREHMRSIR